jgi:CPA2 family monovalent cation:H+ antiporter-2
MHNPELILLLAAGFSAALALGYLTHRLGLSPIVGYLVAGTLVGPYTPGFVGNAEVAEQLAEVGVILLMFGVGLQFHIDELLAVRGVAIPGAIVQSAVATALGAAISRAFGWSWPAAIVFGMALSVASTVVLIRVLVDYRDLHTQTGHIAVGWLVVEDVLTVLALVLLPALFGNEQGNVSVAFALGFTLLKVGALVTFTIVVGSRVIPRALDHVAATGSRELFTLTVLVLALGIAVGAAHLFGVSMALGAFLSGLVVGRSDYSLRAASDALPMRDAFAVLFFVAVGMLLDPRIVIQAPALAAATLVVVLVGKPLAALLLMRVLHYPFRVSLAIAIALAQIGEFSFILSSLGHDLGLFTAQATHTLVAVSIVSIVVNPLLYRAIPQIDTWVNRQPTLRRWLNPAAATEVVHTAPADRQSPDSRAVIVGYGPTGRTVSRLLRENGIEPIVIEMNIDTVRQLRSEKHSAIYGDAAQRDTLLAADVAHAGNLILTSAGMGNAAEAIRTARELNPKVRVFARAGYVRDIDELRRVGADEVFSGESEVALAFTEALLERLGATAEQIDRERERAHAELFGPAIARSRGPVGAAAPHQGS